MINKCKVEMRGGELYNVVESLKEGDGKTVSETKRKRIKRERPTLVSLFFCNNIVHVSDRIGSLRLSSITHPLQIFYCGLRFGPRPDQQNLGQENCATTIGAVCGKN